MELSIGKGETSIQIRQMVRLEGDHVGVTNVEIAAGLFRMTTTALQQ